MKYLRGFMMAWGNFTAIPCPYKKWHDDSRRAMLCMFPLVGAFLGVIVVAAWAVLDLINAPAILTGVLLTTLYFCCTGFIHLDGFMDCSDAILSRRPLEDRQRILKDSTVGAFAVVALMLMLLVFVASMMVLAGDFTLKKACLLIVIMPVSRGIAADSVMRKPVMGSSQYANLSSRGEAERKNNDIPFGEKTVLNAMTIIPFIVLAVLVSDYNIRYNLMICCGVIITMAAAHLTGIYDRKQLGGMSGDISGHMIVLSEAIGVAAAALLAGPVL